MPVTTIRGGRQITDGTIPYVDIQQVAASKLLGNPTVSAATMSEISLGTGLSFSGTSVVLSANLQSLSGLSYSSASFVKMTAAGTFALDTATYALSSHTHSYFIGTTAVQTSSANQALTGITGITFAAEASDSASITSTISGTSTFFDFNLTDDNNNDEWRWRFTPSGGTVYNAMRLVPVSNTAANLIVSGTIASSNFSGSSSGTNTGDQTLSGLGGQPQLNGTGFVKASGTTISYDNSTYYLASNPSGYTTNTGTVTSVGGTGTVSGLTLSGTVTTSGNLTLGGTLSASIDNITDEYRLFNNMGDAHGTRSSFDATIPSYNFGWRYVQGNTNGPGVNSATQYYSVYVGLGNDYLATGAGSYGMQLAIPRNVTTPYISIRYNENNGLGSWQKISAGYADTAGSATTVTSITSGQVTTALGYTPYNATNPAGYTTNVGTVTSVGGTGTVSGLTLTGTVTTSGSLTLGGTLTLTAANVNAVGAITNNTSGTAGSTAVLTASGALTTQQGSGTVIYSYALTSGQIGLFASSDNSNSILTLNRHPGGYYSQLGFSNNGNIYYRAFTNDTPINTSQAWQTIWTSSSLTNLNQLSNGPGYITASSTDTLTNKSGNISQWTNNSGYITSAANWFGAVTTGGTLDWNDVTNTKPGTGYTLLLGNASNGPGAGEYFHSLNLEYSSKDGTGNVTQMAVSYSSPGNKFYMRGRYDGTWNGWNQFVTNSGTWSINITGYASSAGNADTVDGYHASAFALSGHTHDLMRYSLRAPSNVDGMTSADFRTSMFGSSSSGWNLSTARWNATPAALSGHNNYGTVIAWSGSDTHGFLSVNYDSAYARIGGGSADLIQWSKNIAFGDGTGASGTWGINISGNAATATNADTVDGYHASVGNNASYAVVRDGSGDIFFRYSFSSYVNTTDDVNSGSITNIIAKFGDNYHRSASAASVQTFLGLGSMAYASTGSYLPLAGGTMTGKITSPSSAADTYGGAFEIRERGYVLATQTAWSYSPAITFHWGNISAQRFGLRSDGLFAVDDAPIALRSWVQSYSPTLTGGNASGTWGISITGNAATATDAGSVDGIDSSRIVYGDGARGKSVDKSNASANTSDSSNPSGFYFGNTTTGMPTTDWWTWINTAGNSWSGGDGYGFQLAHSFWGDDLKVRRLQSGTWYSWLQVITSGNYNSYSPTLTGGGASGTWGISISGNAATATSATNGRYVYDNGTYSGSTGYVEASSMHVYYASLGRIVYNNGAWSGSGWVEPSDLGVRYANSSAYSGYLSTLYAGGQQTNPQTYFAQSIGLRVAMTGAWSVWSDTLWINGYSGGDVLQMCALHTLRNGTPRMAISVQASNSTSYGSFYEFLTTYNYNSYTPTLTGTGASGTWAINVTGTAAGETLTTVTSRGNSTPSDIFINNASPTIYFRDTDHRSAMIHVNSNVFYVLRGDGNNSTTWSTYNGYWPLEINLDNNNATFGGSITAALDITAYSDIRLKENILTVENALEKVIGLRGVTYNRKDNNDGKRQLGVIAQEVEEILPEVVKEDDHGMKHVAYGNITAILIEAIKEQQAQIEDLKKQIEFLAENK